MKKLGNCLADSHRLIRLTLAIAGTIEKGDFSRATVPFFLGPMRAHRVSTAWQGRSGLGIEAQRIAVTRFAEAEDFTIFDEFTEVETGKGADALDRRPQLEPHNITQQMRQIPLSISPPNVP